MRCFHGTSLKLAKNIIAGNTNKPTGIWSVSDNDGNFYVYPVNKRNNDFGLDVDADDYQEDFEACYEEIVERCRNDAKWHGQAATCYAPMTDLGFVVLEMEIPDDLLNDDNSCLNMDDIASYIPLSELHQVEIVAVHYAELSVYRRPFILAYQVDNDECFTDSEIDDDLMTMARLLKGTDTLCDVYDDICEQELNVYTLEEFKGAF